MLTDLRHRYEKDWFRIANNREQRWLVELAELFKGPRWALHSANLRLRHDGKDLTDIDFAAYDRKTNELGLFQLKWQHPVGIDNRGRRSAGRNLVDESNRWIATVCGWLDRYGVDELVHRLGFGGTGSPALHLFVLGRYHVHLTGFGRRDGRATWADWARFRRVRAAHPRRSISQLRSALRIVVERSRAAKAGESTMFPLGDLSIVLNPRAVPPGDAHEQAPSIIS